MLVTDLWNDAMPFIRYENGDTGQWIEKSCKCGRAMPLFTVQGRMSDYIITPTQVFSPTAIDVLLRNEYFTHIRLVQHNEKELEIFYVPNPLYSPEHIQNFLQTFIQNFKGIHIILNPTQCPITSSSQKQRICTNLSSQSLDNFFSNHQANKAPVNARNG